MGPRAASTNVPLALLTDGTLPPPAKLVWIALRQHPGATAAQVQAQTGLSRPTVLRCLGPAKAYGAPPAGAKVRVPVALLAERSVGAQAKTLYGMLQATPTFRYQEGQFTYASLCALTGLSRNTLKRAIAELSAAGWIRITQPNRLSPIRFSLVSPEATRVQAALDLVRRRLQRRLRPGSSGGEAIMQEYLSLLIDSDRFTDNARPGFLINPLTGQRLELDRYYQAGVAFEYHGDQHDRPTERFSRAEVEEQRLRDLITAGLCVYEGIQLVIVRAPDLSLQGMLQKIGNGLPLRDLTALEPLIDLLEEESIKYVAAYRRAAMK